MLASLTAWVNSCCVGVCPLLIFSTTPTQDEIPKLEPPTIALTKPPFIPLSSILCPILFQLDFSFPPTAPAVISWIGSIIASWTVLSAIPIP